MPLLSQGCSFFQQLKESSEERKGTRAYLQVSAFSNRLLQAACSKPLRGAQPGFLNLLRLRVTKLKETGLVLAETIAKLLVMNNPEKKDPNQHQGTTQETIFLGSIRHDPQKQSAALLTG